MKKKDLIQRIFRETRRQLIRDRVIMDPSKRPKKYLFTWSYGNLTGEVYSDTKSEARSLIKKDLGVKKRLPPEISINRYDNPEYLKGMIQSYENLSGSNGETSSSSNVG